MDGRTVTGWLNGWMDGRMVDWLGGWRDGWMGDWIGGRVAGWLAGWMDLITRYKATSLTQQITFLHFDSSPSTVTGRL